MEMQFIRELAELKMLVVQKKDEHIRELQSIGEQLTHNADLIAQLFQHLGFRQKPLAGSGDEG